MRLRALLFVVALGGVAAAQPVPRDHRHPPPPPGVGVGVDIHLGAEPTEAPPPPQAENHEPTRAGFVWVAGQWDWKGGKYEWRAGHWERERAGKHWREARWEQKDGKWHLTPGEWEAGAEVPPPVAVPPPAGDAPTAPPPPPQAENHEPTRAGFVWVAGSWDWKGNKYEWAPGHWERERAGKHWRDAHWDQRDGKWVRTEGGWDDGAGAPPPPPPGNTGIVPPDMREHHRTDWKLDRPTVSSYWPAKGKAGTKVVIHGVNFPPGGTVLFSGKKVVAALVTPTTIEFMVPGDFTGTGDISIDRGHGRPLEVGSFEVVAGFDPVAEQKRLDDERHKRAETEWAEQQKSWAKDRAARQAAYDKRVQEMEQTRDERRAKRMEEIRAKWNAAFLADADTQDELTLHAQRLAELDRMKDVASVNGDAKLGVRIDVATQKENDRHDQRMQALEAAFKTKGGAP